MPVEHAAQIFSSKCRIKILEQRWLSSEDEVTFTKIGSRENPPPAATNRSCVYLMFRPDERFYVGQVCVSVYLCIKASSLGLGRSFIIISLGVLLSTFSLRKKTFFLGQSIISHAEPSDLFHLFCRLII